LRANYSWFPRSAHLFSAETRRFPGVLKSSRFSIIRSVRFGEDFAIAVEKYGVSEAFARVVKDFRLSEKPCKRVKSTVYEGVYR
jgi:hypothetical protein